MDVPRPSQPHARLAELAGAWVGTDVAYLPDGSTARFGGRYDQRLDLDGWFLAVDYAQEADGAVRYRMRAVIGWLPAEERYFMHWYDSFGGSSTELRGEWQGDALVLIGPDPQEGGLTRFTWRVSGDRLTITLDAADEEGADWARRLDADYARALSD